METLKKLFPFSFKNKEGIGALIVNVIIYLVVGALAGIAIGILAKVPIVGWIVGICGGLVDLYVVIGIILSILDYLKVLK